MHTVRAVPRRSASTDLHDWRGATKDTIRRLRQVLHFVPTPRERTWCLSQARMMVEAMHVEGSRYWPIYVNTVRILAASTIDKEIDADDLFD